MNNQDFEIPPNVPTITITLSDAPFWQEKIDDIIRIANYLSEKNIRGISPPMICRDENDIIIPAFVQIAEALIQTVVRHSDCNPAMTILLCLELNQIKGFDPMEAALAVAGQVASEHSAGKVLTNKRYESNSFKSDVNESPATILRDGAVISSH